MQPVVILLSAVVMLAAGMASAQQTGTPPGDCDPGFSKRGYPHGSEHNFRCRSRVIDCPDRRGHIAVIVLEEPLELAAGVQFGYRCEYRSQDR